MSVEVLRARAKIISTIRNFFVERGVLEVETPLLSPATVTDPHILSIPAIWKNQTFYLQTSPEFAMKRLLAAGSGSIFQICKAFRQDETAQYHHHEFTMLEWYRIGFDHHDLMNEMDELLQRVLNCEPAERMTYADIFEKYTGLNPHFASKEQFVARARQLVEFSGELSDINDWLDLLFTHCIEPKMQHDRPIFVYDYPISQAALAKIRYETPKVASRFEVYFKGIELANGFHELQNSAEQRKRFEADLAYRKLHQLPEVPIDEDFLKALSNLPDCSGVALGLDRLIMLKLNAKTLADCSNQ